MTYDIPPPLQHKEKIMFGLTFSQLAYALPAFLLVIGIVLKSGMSIEMSGGISLCIILFAAFFMFFDGKDKIQNMLRYLKNQEVQVNSQALKDIIDIQRIKDNKIETKKRSLAILEVTPMNLLIRTEEEQEGIIKGFQKFLNSLDFSVQIHISSDLISLKQHLKYLEKKSGDKTELFDSYCKFIKQTISDNNIKNRKFYVIIEKKYDLEIQASVCEDKLKSIGLKVKRLNDKRLLDLFFNYTAQKKEKQVTGNVENFAHFLLAPEKISFYHDFFKVDDTYCKILAVEGYPQSVEKGFLDKVISSGENYDISVHIEPFPIEFTMVELNRELQKQQADLYADSKKGILNPSLEIKFKSTKHVLEELQRGKQKLFNVSLYIMCKAKIKGDEKKAKAEVELLAKKVKADLDGLMMQSSIQLFRMMDSYQSMLPLARDTLKIKRNIHTEGLSAFFPFSSPFLDIEDDGILLGMNKNNIPYIKNIFRLTNANGVILATSGSGKSYFTKLMMSRQHMNGCDVIIIDPQGEYTAVTTHYKGEVITISRESETTINPLDLMGHDYMEKRLSLMDLFQIMFGDLTEIQKAILDKAIDITYGRKGINKDSWKAKQPPKMQDLYQVLVNLERECAAQERITYRALLNRLGMYTDNGVFSFLNKDTNMDFSNKFVCFNIGAMPKQVKPVIMYLVLDFVYMRMKKNLRRKLLIIDEAWSMLQTAEESSYIYEIVKTCRKYNLGLLMITQDVADLISSRAGGAVLANTSYTFLLRQKPAVISSVAKTFNLSNSEKDFLITAEKGQGILILENEHQELNIIASEKEHELITTNPDEINRNKKKPSKHEEISIKLDIEQDVHTGWNKTIEERNFLANNGYELSTFHDLDKGKQKEYFVKRRPPESAQHTYYADLIYQEILRHTDKVWKKRTYKPDVVFINKANEEIALEVETAVSIHKKKYHDEKFGKLGKEYGNRCYIFLTQSKYKNSYTRHKLPILSRGMINNFVKQQFSGQQNNIIVSHLDSTDAQ